MQVVLANQLTITTELNCKDFRNNHEVVDRRLNQVQPWATPIEKLYSSKLKKEIYYFTISWPLLCCEIQGQWGNSWSSVIAGAAALVILTETGNYCACSSAPKIGRLFEQSFLCCRCVFISPVFNIIFIIDDFKAIRSCPTLRRAYYGCHPCIIKTSLLTHEQCILLLCNKNISGVL